MSCFEILWETVKIVIGFDNNRDFIDVLISRIFANFRARARVRSLVQIKKAPERAHARAKLKKKQYFSDFTKGKTN